MQEIAARVTFFQGSEEYVVYGLHCRNHKQATGFFQLGQVFLVLSQVLNFYCHVIGHLGEFAVELFDERNGVAYAIKKVRVAKRDMLRTCGYLAANVLKYNFSRHDPKNAVIYRHDGAVAAQMLASAAGFRRADNAVTVAGNNQMRI